MGQNNLHALLELLGANGGVTLRYSGSNVSQHFLHSQRPDDPDLWHRPNIVSDFIMRNSHQIISLCINKKNINSEYR